MKVLSVSAHPDVELEPPHLDPIEERRHRKQKLAAVYRTFAALGFDEGVSGHVSARDPERTDHFWINPYGLYFGHLRASDLMLVAPDGEVVEGRGRLHRAAFSIHSEVLMARPDVNAVSHGHTTYGKVWTATGRLLEPLTQDALSFHGNHAVMPYTGVTLDADEGAKIAEALAGHKALLLANHGQLTVGATVDEAAWWFISLDHACEVQVLAGSIDVTAIPRDIAQPSAALAGSAAEGWLNFQPYWQRVRRAEPDLLD